MGKTIRFNENGLIAIKKRLNEVMVGIDDVSHNDIVTLWHGTDIPGIVGILKSGTICARDGVQHGETYGMNWFSLKKVNNFNKGIVFSIEVPSSEFKTKFKMMNSSEAITRDDRFDISQYNLKIEMFCTFGREQLNRYYDLIVEKGEHYPIETIRDEVFYKWCEKSGNEDMYMSTSDYDLGLILSNILGEDKVRAEGFLEENTNLNEAAPEVDEYTICGEEKDGENVAGGNYFHVAESIDFDNNGMSINDDKILGKYNLKDLILSKTGNYVTLNKIIANEFGKGSGSRFMEELTRMADKNGWTLALTPDTSFGGSSIGRLKKFYKRFGFVPNKGRSTDFNTRESMIRKPLNENKYDDLFDIRNLNKKIPDCEETISYFKNVSNEITEKMKCISSKYGCKSMFFIVSVNQGVIQANQNDVNEFCRLGDERREIEEKIKALESIIKNAEEEGKREKEAQKYRLEQEENDRIFSLVIDEYGTTNSIVNAEYILPDGTMLYSGGDHRGIASVYAVNNISIFDDTYRYNYVVDFLNRGAIRCRMLESGSILDMTKEPTDKQYSLIKTFVRYAGGTVDIDFTDSKGDTSYSVSYSNAIPQQVVADIYKYYNEGIKPQGNVQFESKENKKIIIPENKLDVIKENIESEVESSEVDLSSFKKRDSLPPKIWKDEETLDSKVRLKLLDIADDFWEFVNLSWVEPKSIIITGSICNFNWSKFSDIDLHLIVDFSEIDSKTEFVKQYLDSKKNEWNTEHDGLKIMGFPVELYVQDVNENPEAGGIYDLEENAWVRKPNPHTIKSIGLNKFNIKDKAAEIMTIIDDMYDMLSSTSDAHVLDQVGEDAHYLWDKVKDLRKKSLKTNGESGSGNIVYKVLRRTGYLDRLFKLFSVIYDKSNSITESNLHLLTESKEMLNEFLDNNYGIPLYKYFQWAEKASDRDKVEDLFYHCPWIIGKYLDNVSGYDEELSELEDELLGDRDLEYDEEYIERVLDALEKHKLLRKLLDYPYAYTAAEELPAWFFMDFIRVVKNEWCIHFTSDANNIARKGFTGGTPEVEDLAYTGAGREKHSAGYDFAFLINDRSVDFNGYGDEAVIFRASGVLLLHYGDEQRQVVFWGPSVKEVIPIKKDDYSSDWIIEGLNGQVFKTGKPSELADWATDNLPQYRNQIVAGKSGYRPWGFSRPTFDHEFMKPPLSNESVKKYLTLLKEEVALDGSTEDNPYEKRWKAEREALKNFIANYGKLMQSREDNKMGRLYKVYYDETMSNLIGYNYCICVQWDELTMKPKSTVYIRALDKFTPFIRRNLQFDTRGRDNVLGNQDDIRY